MLSSINRSEISINQMYNNMVELKTWPVNKSWNPYSILGDSTCKTRENSNFLKNGKMVISVKSEIFLDLG